MTLDEAIKKCRDLGKDWTVRATKWGPGARVGDDGIALDPDDIHANLTWEVVKLSRVRPDTPRCLCYPEWLPPPDDKGWKSESGKWVWRDLSQGYPCSIIVDTSGITVGSGDECAGQDHPDAKGWHAAISNVQRHFLLEDVRRLAAKVSRRDLRTVID